MNYCYGCGRISDYVNILIEFQDIYICDECIDFLYSVKDFNMKEE